LDTNNLNAKVLESRTLFELLFKSEIVWENWVFTRTKKPKREVMAGAHTLRETERHVDERLAGMDIDFQAMAVTSNLFRAASAVRNHLERSVLAAHDLSWSAFVVLWVVWIWEDIETREIAAEAGFSKATLTGVLNTLEKRGYSTRKRSKDDGRLVIVSMTAKGRKLMEQLFPLFNKQEQFVASALAGKTQPIVADGLRKITELTEPAVEN
jgi:DNA-binding MarR family transcriptional regulator